MKIGLAVISYNRPHYLKQCLESLQLNSWGGADVRIIIIDEVWNEKYAFLDDIQHNDPTIYVQFQENAGVGAAKNKALSSLLLRGCDHLFVMEDDILMKHPGTCQVYIEAALVHGVPHLNFGLHGRMNKGKGRMVEWKGIPRWVYPDCVGAFSYYTKEILEEVGLMDPNFKNAWEHVEHTWRICKTGKIPPFWYFMDSHISDALLEEIPDSIDNSSIRPRLDWNLNIERGMEYWKKKHGEFLPPKPAWPTSRL